MPKNAFDMTIEEFELACQETLQEAGNLGVEIARSTTKFNIGHLAEKIKFVATSSYEGFVIADAPYAQYLEYGNPYEGFIITPKNKKCLHFFVGSDEIFTKKVRAHGAYNFMADSAEAVDDALPMIFDKHIR